MSRSRGINTIEEHLRSVADCETHTGQQLVFDPAACDFLQANGDHARRRTATASTPSRSSRSRRPQASRPTVPANGPVFPPYRPPTPSRTPNPSTPQTPAVIDSDGSGWALLLAAVVAALFLSVGQLRDSRATTDGHETITQTRTATSASPSGNRTIEVIRPDSAMPTGFTRDGDRITVTAREVVLDASWVIDRPTIISGRGPDASTITYGGPGTLLNFVGDGTLRIEGVTLSRRSSDPGDVVAVGSGTLELVDAHLQGGVAGTGYAGAGLRLDRRANARIDRSTLVSNAVGLRLLDDASAQVVNSDVRGNQGIGILLTGKSDGIIRDSRIERNGAEGIVLGDESTATIADNRVVENGARGLSFLRQSSATAVRNEIAENGYGVNRDDYWQGIAVQDEAHATLEKNTVRENAGVGIQFLHSADGTARENTVTGNSANLAPFLQASGRRAASAGGLVLGLLGQPQDPRPTLGTNLVTDNHGGDVVDYRPDAKQVAPPAPSMSPPLATPPPSTPSTPDVAILEGPTPPPASTQLPIAPPLPTTKQPPPRYVLSSTSDGRGHLEADDHLNVYLEDAPLYTDRRAPTGAPIAPISFEAARGTSLWVEVVNTMGDACRWTDVYVVDRTGTSHRVLRGNAASSGCRLGIVALVEFVLP